ncbi:GNAT family N-acetyltransferase [Shimazuella soli]|uniref:GNAT family N-acetyltransferase n=1 Tax=Shimazuella soli TaxID=1892854 RepID=UPI0030B807A8
MRPSDDVILYTILVEDKVAGIIYLEPRSTKISDVGYLLMEDYRKKGVIQLVLVTVLDQLFGQLLPNGGLEQVWAFVNRKNDQSLRFHEKIGMQELPSQDISRIFAFSQDGWRKAAPKVAKSGISRFRKG